MKQTLTIQQLAEATDLSRTQIDQWISRGHFKPEHTPETGKARTFTNEDAVTLGALAELVRIGIRPTVASMHVNRGCGFTENTALLVVTQGPMDTVPSNANQEAAWSYDPLDPPTRGRIVRINDLPEIAADPLVRSMAVVNLSEVEKRVLAVAERE